MSESVRYRPSGRCGLAATLFYTATIGCGGAVILAGAYQGLIDGVGVAYANVVLLFGLAIGVALGAAFAVRAGKCRNPLGAALVGVVCGLAAEAASFEFAQRRLAAAIGPAIAPAPGGAAPSSAVVAPGGPAVHADALARFVRERTAFGWMARSRAPACSIGLGLLWAIWLLEGALLVGLAAATASLTARLPFCEDCVAWTVPTRLGPSGGVEVEAVRRAIATVELGAKTVRYTAHDCRSCERSWVAIELVGNRARPVSLGSFELPPTERLALDGCSP